MEIAQEEGHLVRIFCCVLQVQERPRQGQMVQAQICDYLKGRLEESLCTMSARVGSPLWWKICENPKDGEAMDIHYQFDHAWKTLL